MAWILLAVAIATLAVIQAWRTRLPGGPILRQIAFSCLWGAYGPPRLRPGFPAPATPHDDGILARDRGGEGR